MSDKDYIYLNKVDLIKHLSNEKFRFNTARIV